MTARDVTCDASGDGGVTCNGTERNKEDLRPYICCPLPLVPTVGERKMKPADHPATCTGCRGTGFMDGPPEFEIVNGEPHGYTTVTTCTHHWSDDNPELWDGDL